MIQRYDMRAMPHPLGFKSEPFVSTVESPDGEWVRYDSHQRAVEDLEQNAREQYHHGLNDGSLTSPSQVDEKFDREAILETCREWKHFWMNQTHHSEADRKNYFDRAFGIDSNMIHHLADKLWTKLRGGKV